MTTLVANPPADGPRRQAAPAVPHGMTSAMATVRAATAVVTEADWQQITNYLEAAS